MIKIKGYDSISINNIDIPKYNIRTRNIDKGLDDLAISIRANGLLQPITVYFDLASSRYKIIQGQRRYNAHQRLNENYSGEGFDRIRCIIIEEPESEEEKKSLSLSENITQLPMDEHDLRRAVTDLYNKYNNHEIVEREFGLSKYMVDKYVRLARLPEEVKQAVEDGKIHPNPKRAESNALRAVDALEYTPSGPHAVEHVIGLATEMAKGNIKADDLADEAAKGGTILEIKERARGKKDKLKVIVSLASETGKKLQAVASASGESEDECATRYVVTGTERDYEELGD